MPNSPTNPSPPALSNPPASLQWPRGKTLGGSSSINGLLYIRGQREDYDYWRQLGNAGWSYEDVLPYFKRSEANERGGDEFHGSDGGLAVSDMRAARDVCDAFIDAAVELGVPRSDDFNGDRQEGAGYFQLTASNGRRCSAAVAFLRPVRHRRNLEVVTNAHVEGLSFANGGDLAVDGITYSVKGSQQRAGLKAGGEIVLSAGAIGSPQILQLSGIGPGSLLQEFDIPVRHELAGVGQNLQDHLQIRMIYEVNVPTLNDEINNWFRRSMIGMDYVFRRRGPMALGASQVCVFTKSRSELERPDIQYHLQPLSADKPGIEMHRFSGITASVCQLRPESKGTIEIRSRDPHVYPKITPNYLSAALDQDTAVAAMQYTRRLVKTEALSRFVVSEKTPGEAAETDEQLLDAARNISQTIYHPTSTCKMGSDVQAVVDERLRVHGVKGLRVADASIMPAIVSGNTNAPTIMIGEKASDMILEDRQA